MKSNAEQYSGLFVALADALKPSAPSAGLRERVLSVASPRPERLVQAEEGTFEPFLLGISIKLLRRDASTETSLWKLEPNAVIPAHGHQHEEECFIVSGEIEYAGRKLVSGDYLLANAAERQSSIRSATGAVLLIRGELRPTLGPVGLLS